MDLLCEKYFNGDKIHEVRTTMLESFWNSVKDKGEWRGSLSDCVQTINELHNSDIRDGFETCWNILRKKLEEKSKLETWFLLLKDTGIMTEEMAEGKKKQTFYFPTCLTLGDKSTYWMCKLDSPGYLIVDHSRKDIAIKETLKKHWDDLTEEGKRVYAHLLAN